MTRVICFTLSLIFLSACALVAEAQERVPVRPIAEMRKDMRAFVKQTKSKDAFVYRSAMLDLCFLHWEVSTDPRYETFDQLKTIRMGARKRLVRYVKELRNDLNSANTSLALSKGPSNVDQAAYSVAASSANLMSALHGGPQQTQGFLGGNFGPAGDHSAELIALIEATISPSSWKTSGTGEASIAYFEPCLALVVTAPQEVQDRILVLLHKLR